MWNPFSRAIHVQFIDVATGKLFVQSSMPPSHLPDTFALDTTLHLPEGDWRVVRAVPLAKKEFARTRKLELWVSKVGEVATMDPSKILYSLPTISNELPPSDGAEADGSELVLHEDDWRQVEWVGDVPEIGVELASIRGFVENHQAGSGFRKIHVRELIARPLIAAEVGLDRVLECARQRRDSLKPLRFENAATRVRGGFAVPFEGGWIYGLTSSDAGARVDVLGVLGGLAPGEVNSRIGQLHAGIVLVDWCRAQKFEGCEP